MPRCRRTSPILSSGTPWRSISVAALCRRAWAPLTGGTMPARFMIRFTTDEMPSHRRNGRHGHHGRGPAKAERDEVPTNEPGTVDGVVVAPAAFGAWTPASAQVLAERGEINVRQARALLGHHIADVSRRSQIAYRCLGP